MNIGLGLIMFERRIVELNFIRSLPSLTNLTDLMNLEIKRCKWECKPVSGNDYFHKVTTNCTRLDISRCLEVSVNIKYFINNWQTEKRYEISLIVKKVPTFFQVSVGLRGTLWHIYGVSCTVRACDSSALSQWLERTFFWVTITLWT